MKTVPAAKFKAQCLALIDQVRGTREPILITKRGKAVAKVVPVEPEKDDFIGSWEGKIEFLGDIVGLIVDPEDWDPD